MPEWIGQLIFFSIFVIVVGGILRHQSRSKKSGREAFSAVALRLGFEELAPKSLLASGVNARHLKTSARGRYRGHEVMMVLAQRAEGDSGAGQLATSVVVSLPRAGMPNLALAAKAGMRKLLVGLGAQDILTGSQDFDAQVVVKSDNPDWAKRVLTPEIQSGYLKMPSSGAVEVRAGQVRWDALGVETNVEFLAFLVDFLVTLATEVDCA